MEWPVQPVFPYYISVSCDYGFTKTDNVREGWFTLIGNDI